MVENSNEVLIIVYAHGITSDYESYACQHNSNSQREESYNQDMSSLNWNDNAKQLVGNHEHLQQAYMSAKLGEVYRYGQQYTSLAELTVPNTHQMASVTPAASVAAICKPDKLSSLENKLQELYKKSDGVTLLSRNTSNRTSDNVAVYALTVNKRDIL